MSSYVYDRGARNAPLALAQHPYSQQVGWNQALLKPTGPYVAPGSQLTSLSDDAQPAPQTDKLIMAAVIIACAFLLWKLITPEVKSNPKRRLSRGGKNSTAKVYPKSDGYYYRLAGRRRSKEYGPYSHDGAIRRASCKGYEVVE
jgi:hypothetical protein